jgi:DNA replication protein DnaC
MTAQLDTRLRHLRLSGMADALPARVQQATAAPLSHREFLELLVEDELACRADRLFARRLKQAGITAVQDFADFDWSFNPKLPRARLCELATGRFIAQHQNVLLIGPPGVGKSHAVVAMAVGAIRAGYRVRIRSSFDLAQDFAEAETMGERRALVAQLTQVDLLPIEDFGMRRLGSTAAEDLLEIFIRRHEKASTLITTNRPTEDWGQFLGDVPATTAILDRFLHHADILRLQGKSYACGSGRCLSGSTACRFGPTTEEVSFGFIRRVCGDPDASLHAGLPGNGSRACDENGGHGREI